MIEGWQIRMAYMDTRDWFYAGLSRILPARLVYWAHVRVTAWATTQEYRTTDIYSLTVQEAIDRWTDDHNL
jgi:hypothetical protein